LDAWIADAGTQQDSGGNNNCEQPSRVHNVSRHRAVIMRVTFKK